MTRTQAPCTMQTLHTCTSMHNRTHAHQTETEQAISTTSLLQATPQLITSSRMQDLRQSQRRQTASVAHAQVSTASPCLTDSKSSYQQVFTAATSRHPAANSCLQAARYYQQGFISCSPQQALIRTLSSTLHSLHPGAQTHSATHPSTDRQET